MELNRSSLTFVVFAILFSALGVAQKQDSTVAFPGTKQLNKQAAEFKKALEKNDFEKQISLTHPLVIKHFGGKQTMLANAKREADQTKRAGFDIVKAEIAPPLPGKRANGVLYRCVPIMITVNGPYGKIFSQAGLLGISDDQGEHWQFISLAQIDTQVLLTILPDLPTDLEIPFKQVTTEK